MPDFVYDTIESIQFFNNIVEIHRSWNSKMKMDFNLHYVLVAIFLWEHSACLLTSELQNFTLRDTATFVEGKPVTVQIFSK